MKQVSIFIFPLLLALTSLFVQGQSIRTAGNKMRQVRPASTDDTPITYTGNQILVGSGGKGTGLPATYCLLDNGKLFGKRSHDKEFTFIAQQTPVNTKRIFAVVEDKCKIKTVKFDHPGATSKFIHWRKGKQENKVVWAETDKKAPANYSKFYESFMATIPVELRLK